MRPPTTHISALAALSNMCIQMVDPGMLIDALDGSSDLRPDLGDTMGDSFTALLEKKFSRCSEWFNTNLATLGIQEPLVVIIYPDGRWVIDDGHHRLAWALIEGVAEVPVVFDDTGAGDESDMGCMVQRVGVTAYHSTTNEELLMEAEAALVEEAIDYLSVKTAKMPKVVAPVPVGRHRSGGRHRSR